MTRKRLSVVFGVALGILASTSTAQTATGDAATASRIFPWGEIAWTAGVRVWGSEWDIPQFETVAVLQDPRNPASLVLQDTVTTQLSSFEPAVIPFIGFRAGNFIASASYFTKTRYDSRSSLGRVSRDEFDLTAGYSILPPSDASLVVSVGYKRGNIGATSTTLPNRVKIDGWLIGVTGNAAVTENLRLYGNAAVGPARQKLKDDIPGAEENRKLDALYRVGEVGFTYLFFRGSPTSGIGAASVSLAYRAQVYTIKSVAFATRSPTSPQTVILDVEKRDIDSTTQGPILALNVSF